MTDAPLWFLGTLVRPKLSGADTNGQLALWECELPRGAAPPVHTHPQDETMIILDGAVRVWIGDRLTTHGRGDAVFVAREQPHAFRVDSDTARVLFLSTPAGIEEFVRALAVPADWPWLQPPADGPRVPLDELAAIERQHGVVRLGPPPSD